VDHVDLGARDKPTALRLKLTHAGLRGFESLGELIALGLDARLLSSLVAFPLASLLGFVFPLIAAMSHFGQLAHNVSLSGNGEGQRSGCKMPIGPTLSP
jgi:hypothetical protein